MPPALVVCTDCDSVLNLLCLLYESNWKVTTLDILYGRMRVSSLIEAGQLGIKGLVSSLGKSPVYAVLLLERHTCYLVRIGFKLSSTHTA